ncbi:MAG TPA: discoidin domain-containing protein [Polyangiaceae bacterium]|nr:discoidin domain-containing protein [Polyangiaceae bacterium]
MTAASAIGSIFREQVTERLLLRRAERVVRERAPAQQQTVHELYEAARVRLLAAAEMADPARMPAAGTLGREALVLFVHALRVARDPQAELLSPAEAHGWLEQRAQAGEFPKLAEDLVGCRPVLLDADLLALDRMSTEDAYNAYGALERSLSRLRSAIEPRTTTQIRRSRILRLGVVCAIAIAILALLLVKLLQQPSLAQGKPASASSYHPSSPSAAGATNGKIESNFGVHTQVQENAWVRVDLETPQRIERIKVYNRADGWQDEVVPLVLEVSSDGKNWRELEQRSKTFTQDKPWTWKGDAVTARYVQVRRPKQGYIALTEIEVFGSAGSE